MANSQNAWPVLNHDQTYKWIIPVKSGKSRHFVLQPGYAGFILAHLALWFHETIEKINEGIWDEWGWAPRPIRGSSIISNHASGTAIDINATKHPLGVANTFRYFIVTKVIGAKITRKQYAEHVVRLKMAKRYRGVVRWGGDYRYRKDAMHFEIDRVPSSGSVRRLAVALSKTRRGRRILRANPGRARALGFKA